jgi:hypothetical protein
MSKIEVGSFIRILESDQGFEVGAIHRVTRINRRGTIVNLVNVEGLSHHHRCDCEDRSYQEYKRNCEKVDLPEGFIDKHTGYRQVKAYERV